MRDPRSLVVLGVFTVILLVLLLLLPMTATKVIVLAGILAVLLLATRWRAIDWQRLAVLGSFLVVLLLPVVFRTSTFSAPTADRQLVIITPHNEQIRTEFARGFESWHLEQYDEPVSVAWNVPGGTSEIRRMLQAQFTAALKEGRAPGGDADLVFGGGSYEHQELKKGVDVTVKVDGRDETRHSSITQPGGLDDAFLAKIYGQDEIAGVRLWDQDQHWYGAALSAFGLVYNRDVLERLDLEEPRNWDALVNPRLRTWIALVNPNQSGSITTAFETILERRGWTPGWEILRRASANARDFSASSLKAPMDVSQGDAAVGVCIDFFGRYQSQAIADHGGGDRIGYVDPVGDTKVDPDPISMLVNAPDPELARRFIQFVLEVPGQSLWQFAPNAEPVDELGPRMFALRRLPVNRALYARYAERMIDQIDPYAEAQEPAHPDRAMRAFIAPIFGAMAMDNHELLVEAWDVILSHPAYPDTTGVVTADMVEDPGLKAMLEAFDAMPAVEAPDSATRIALDTPEGRSVIKSGWLRDGWKEKGLWPEEAEPQRVLRQHFADFFAGKYEAIIKMGRSSEEPAGG